MKEMRYLNVLIVVRGYVLNVLNKFSIPLCGQCMTNRITSDRQLLIKNSIIMAVLFIFGFTSSSGGGFFSSFLMGLAFAGIPWGWSFLNRITPNIFIFMPVVGWLIYLFVKLTIAMMIGIFVTPYKIYKVVKGLNDAKLMEEYTNNIA